jgi:hypothetical protein
MGAGVAAGAEYPEWFYYPSHSPAPGWVSDFIAVVAGARSEIESRSVDELKSDVVLAHLRPGLEALGYEVERGKRKVDKVFRPVLFGAQGRARVTYEIDAAHDELGVVVEVEAGRGARGNAAYRDLVRTSLIVGARFLVLGVMSEYRHQTGGKQTRVESYREISSQLDAVYASGRLGLPFEGVLLFGY